MAVDYNFHHGVDLPSWHWLTPYPAGASNPGTASAYDGDRYIYWLVQRGTTTAGDSASTTELYRYDTWTNGWQFLWTTTGGNQGMDIEHDPVRNVIWLIFGGNTTEWRYFNLNTTALTLCGLTTQPWTMSAVIATVLPAPTGLGSSLALRSELDLPAEFGSGVCGTGSTTTAVVANAPSFTLGMVGLQVRFVGGALAGQKRLVTNLTNSSTLALTRALGSAPVAGQEWVLELPADTAVSGSTTTLVTPGGLLTNEYANADIIITAGTGVGQRRRIASNDATTLTLASAVTGAARTGPFATAPDATSVYQIVPSSDFLYFMAGRNAATFHRIDITATTLAWSTMTAVPGTVQGGGNLLHPHSSAPFRLLAVRGNASNSIYLYDPGLNTWATLNTAAFAQDTLNTGASTCLMGSRNKIFIQKDASARCYTYDLVTGAVDAAGFMPYANPASYEGKRARFVVTESGVTWVYLMRAGGQEFYRVPIEWL